MVNMEMVKEKLTKGITTGVGVFGSTFVGNAIENNSDFGDLGVAGGQMLLGAGIAVGSERLGSLAGERTGAQAGLVEVATEHIGYGIHGAGFAEAADSLNSEQTGAMRDSPDRVVTVDARAGGSGATSSDGTSAEEYSLDTA
jgi:hypothetical protein